MRSVLLVTALAACSGETAIVLEIHKAPGVSSEVKALHVFAGVGHDEDLIDAAWWVAADLDESEAEVTLEDEMGATTYRYLVRPGGGLPADAELTFAVAGYKNATDDEPVVFGHSAGPVRFGDGEVRVYDFPLVTFSAASHGVTASGCAWWDDEGMRVKRDAITPRDDGDCDSYLQDPDDQVDCMLDCRDRDPEIHPGQTEICADDIDQNCCDDDDGRVDLDGDTFSVCGAPPTDCVDLAPGTAGPRDVFGREVASAAIHPGAVEVCDGLDNNCAGGCDDGEGFDPDGDSYFNCRDSNGDDVVGVHRVAPDLCEASEPDCLETPRLGAPLPAQFNPGADDVTCDGWDQDCSGGCDEERVDLGDQDQDGFPGCTSDAQWVDDTVPQCRHESQADCGMDDDPFALPGRAERCDGLDFDCDMVLFPALSPCFVLVNPSTEPRCMIGRRTCNDTPGSGQPHFGVCERDANGPGMVLPLEWCDPQQCTIATDPIQCLTDADTQCDVPFASPEAQMPCMPPPADIPLPPDGAPDCNYMIVGGQHGDWQITLVNGVGQTGSVINGCMSALRVVAAKPDAEDRAVLVLTATRPRVILLKRQDQCNGTGQGLVCTITP